MGPHGHEGMMQGGQSMWMAPIMGGIFAVMLFLAAFTAWQLWRRREQLGAMVRSQLGGARQTPEFKAREILAERFARGERRLGRDNQGSAVVGNPGRGRDLHRGVRRTGMSGHHQLRARELGHQLLAETQRETSGLRDRRVRRRRGGQEFGVSLSHTGDAEKGQGSRKEDATHGLLQEVRVLSTRLDRAPLTVEREG